MKRINSSIILITIMVSTFVLSSCKRGKQMPVSDNYPTKTIETTSKTLNMEYSASVKGCNDVDIYPQVSGTITQICVKEGAHVSRGQTLFIINQVPYRASYQNAVANVQSARATLATAKLTLESKQKLFDQKVISNFDLMQARNSYHSTQASLSQAQANLTKAANDLSYTVVRSPVSGVAGMISLRVGALVNEQMSEPLITVSDDSKMYVYFSLTEQQVLEISKQSGKYQGPKKRMSAVTLRQSDGSIYSLQGKIDAISGLVDKQTGSVTVRASFLNTNHELRSGSSATVIVPRVIKDCIVVPQTATFEIQDREYVYKVVNGKTKSTEIKTLGVNDGKEFIVTEGLNVGDIIISDGARLLKDGVSVKIKK